MSTPFSFSSTGTTIKIPTEFELKELENHYKNLSSIRKTKGEEVFKKEFFKCPYTYNDFETRHKITVEEGWLPGAYKFLNNIAILEVPRFKYWDQIDSHEIITYLHQWRLDINFIDFNFILLLKIYKGDIDCDLTTTESHPNFIGDLQLILDPHKYDKLLYHIRDAKLLFLTPDIDLFSIDNMLANKCTGLTLDDSIDYSPLYLLEIWELRLKYFA